jgi:hypothetical protein
MLPALHFYQLAIPAPKAPAGSYDQAAAMAGKAVFNGKAKCARCHVPPVFTEPGNNLHTPEEVGVDSFQADRSPTHMYRTAPLRGLWSHQKSGFYHDGRFATLNDVVALRWLSEARVKPAREKRISGVLEVAVSSLGSGINSMRQHRPMLALAHRPLLFLPLLPCRATTAYAAFSPASFASG